MAEDLTGPIIYRTWDLWYIDSFHSWDLIPVMIHMTVHLQGFWIIFIGKFIFTGVMVTSCLPMILPTWFLGNGTLPTYWSPTPSVQDCLGITLNTECSIHFIPKLIQLQQQPWLWSPSTLTPLITMLFLHQYQQNFKPPHLNLPR